eukprot:109621_1
MSFLFCLDINAETLFLLCLSIFSLLSGLVTITYGSIRMYNNKKLSKLFKIIYYLNNICWLCSLIGYTLMVILPLTPQCFNPLGPIANFGFWGYNLGFDLLYLLFIIRLYKIFEPTPHKLSIPTIVLLSSGIVVLFISHTLTGHFYNIYEWDYAYITGTIWVFANLFYSFTLVIIFIYKTIALHKSITKNIIYKTVPISSIPHAINTVAESTTIPIDTCANARANIVSDTVTTSSLISLTTTTNTK